MYISTAAADGDNIFSRAMPDDSDLLRIGAPPKVLMVSLSDANGVSISEEHRDKSSMDPDVLSGLSSAVNNLVKDSVKELRGEEEREGLDVMSYRDDKLGSFTIRIRKGSTCVLVVSYKGDPSVDIENDISRTIRWIEDNYKDEIVNWSRDVNEKFIDNISKKIRDTFLDSGKYDGKYDMDSMMECKEEIKERLVEKIQNNTATAFLFDDVECIDPLSLELLDHILHNTSAVIVCQYNTDVLEGGISNENLDTLISEFQEQGRCTHISIRSDVDIETVIRSKLASVDQKSLRLIKYAAVADTFDKKILARAMKSTDIDIGDLLVKLRHAGIVKNNSFANPRLRERALEKLEGKEKRQIEIHVVSSLAKTGAPQYSVRIAELLLPYAKNHELIRKKAIEFSIDAGDLLLRNFDTERALEFYNNAIALDHDEERKQKILEKILILESLTWR
ncbi:MAG: hypothetical protein R6U17_07810 [Thermoplasmata archaeon]